MGRQAGQPERKSEWKRESNRRNAARPRVGARRGSEAGEEQLKQCVEALRTGAGEAVEVLARIMGDRLHVVRDGQRVRVRAPASVRLRAAVEWLDRSGLVRRSESTVQIATAPPKLVTIRHYPPPPSWNPDPPAQPLATSGEPDSPNESTTASTTTMDTGRQEYMMEEITEESEVAR